MRLLPTVMLGIGLTLAGAAIAQTTPAYPSKPLKIIVPISPGSATDILVRTVAERMQARLGVPVIIENRAGAGTTIGAAVVAKSDPDGYTILSNSAAHTVNPFLYRNLPYDSATDFTGVTPLANLPNILVVSPQSPLNSVQELIAAARNAPGKLNYASAGMGSGTHMNAEKFRIAASIVAEHIAFKGTPEAVTETMTGRIDWFFAPGVSVLNQIRDKKLRALAMGSKERLSQFPDLPTTEEAGVPNSAYNFWVGLFVPAKTPAAIVARLNQEVVAALQTPEVKERYAKLGAEPMPMSVEAFRTYLAQEFKVTEQIVKAAGIKPQD
jgi:tripartite-type tricarboxylate transporter receptor subunit TctC